MIGNIKYLSARMYIALLINNKFYIKDNKKYILMSLYLPFHKSILVLLVVVVVVVAVVVIVRVVEHLFKIHVIQNRKSKIFSAKIFLQCCLTN
jgi:hypothetical protein